MESKDVEMEDWVEWMDRAKEDPRSVLDAPEWARDHEYVMSAAVGTDPHALQFASDRLRDSGLVDLAVSKDGMALRHALGWSRCDEDVCREAVFRDGGALQFVPKSCASRKIILTAVRSDPGAVRFVRDALLEDLGLAEDVVECEPDTFQYLPAELANRPGVQAAAKSGRSRVARRRLSKDGFRGLMSRGLDGASLLYQDIRDAMPDFALSEYEIAEVADLLEFENSIPVFADEMARMTPETSVAWRRNHAFREFLGSGFSEEKGE